MTYIDFFKSCALTSAAAPKLEIIEARRQTEEEDEKIGINALEIRTAQNQRCVTYLSDSESGKKTLKSRARAEGLLEGKLNLSQEGIKVERCLLEKEQKDLDKEEYRILICSFSPGASPLFRSLSEEECFSFGKAVGSVHSSKETFEGFASFSASSIRFELEEWIKRLREADGMDSRILDAWEGLERMDALWDFSPSFIHGGWKGGQVSFMRNGLCSLSKWEEAQISDPARDLEWMFSHEISQGQIDAFMQGYAMAMNGSVDPFILPRAKLWRQMRIGAGLLEAQKKGEDQKALFLARKLLRLSEDLRSITPQEPQASLPASGAEDVRSAQRGVKDLEKEPTRLPSTEVHPSTSQMPNPQEKSEDEKMLSADAKEAGEKDPALQSAMWRVAVQAALAKREGRDLMAEVEAAKRAQEAEELNERETTEFGAASFALGKSPSMGADVHLKKEGGVREKEQGEALSPSRPSSLPLSTPSAASQSQTKVIEKIDRNGNE